MRFDSDVPLQSAAVGGHAISYLEAGSGPALVLVHGSLCDCRYWRPQMAPLARHFRVIAISLRHYWPASEGDETVFSVRQHADDVVGLIDALQLDAAHVIGHSRGARVALDAAVRHPAAVRSLVLADPPGPILSPPTPLLPSAYLADAVAELRAGRTEAGLARFVDGVNGEHTWARMVEGFKRMARDNATTLPLQVGEPLEFPGETAVRSLSQPLLLVGGGASPARYAQAQAELKTLVPHARHVVIDGAAHGMNLARPHAFNTAVNGFLSALAAP